MGLLEPWAQDPRSPAFLPDPAYQVPPRLSGYLTPALHSQPVERDQIPAGTRCEPTVALHTLHWLRATAGAGPGLRLAVGAGCLEGLAVSAGAEGHGNLVGADPGVCTAAGPHGPGEAGAGPAGAEAGAAEAGAEVRTAELSSGFGLGWPCCLSLHGATLSIARGQTCVPPSFHSRPQTGHLSKLAAPLFLTYDCWGCPSSSGSRSGRLAPRLLHLSLAQSIRQSQTRMAFCSGDI